MVKAEFAIFQGVPIFKSSPQPNAPTDFLQTIRFGKLKVHGFQKYMSAKVPRGGEGFDIWPAAYKADLKPTSQET